MQPFVFDPSPVVSLAVAGTDARFPVRRVFCVGRNYAAHAREMGSDPSREPPFFFTKPADAVIAAGGTVPFPPMTNELHHEVEMVVALGKGGSNIDAADALDLVWGYGIGLDLTRRDLQAEAKRLGRPWDWAKGFDASAVCGDLTPVGVSGHPARGAIWLKVGDQLRQQGDLEEMIWSVADVIAAISCAVALAPGDLIFTGTPAGVGPLLPGEHVVAGIDGIGTIAFDVGAMP